ncbi:cyclic nucleotide-binding domain-containing protein [Flavobacterium sp. CSZ]|uniref:Crp/Fnr family transcriptional regulator n=1 Tax=Flavobacterium sp. CSZ TaxID=2783791 RepID=UPI00188BF66E|nr:cyclic nucleotide-binding domain-containing protein [Flavobacterium sp. CSZ]MBF4488117.1 Crp/Fnr family transcriptional regulator [Flavobacterium sp. CSZ]
MSVISNNLISFLDQYHVFDQKEKELILDYFMQSSDKEADYLFHGGHVPDELFFISSGVLRILVQNEKGNSVTHFFLKENQFCTILNNFKNATVATESIQAACTAQVFRISKRQLEELYLKIPAIEAIIAQSIQETLLEKILIRNSYLGEDSTTKYRKFILQQPEIASRVSLSDIAAYLEITPQSLSRIRRNIK